MYIWELYVELILKVECRVILLKISKYCYIKYKSLRISKLYTDSTIFKSLIKFVYNKN